MLFDIFCGCVERHLPKLRPLAESVKLFVFEGKPHEFLKERPGYHEDFDQSLFALPFSEVAVEDAGSLVILADLDLDNHVGLDKPRMFIDVQSINVDTNNLEHTHNLEGEALLFEQELQRKYPKAIGVNIGTLFDVSLYEGKTQFFGMYEAERSFVIDKKAGIILESPQNVALKEYMRSAASNAQVALEEIARLSRKTDFVLESTTARPKKLRRGAIARSHERPQFTILQPDQIRKVMEVETPMDIPKGMTRMPHERRRHLRRLVPGEGKPWKKEKVITVEACWIGPSESEVRGKKYRVRLDV